MNWLDSVINLSQNKRFLYFIFLFFIVVFLSSPLKTLLDNTIVEYLFKNFQGNTFQCFTFLFLILLIFFYFLINILPERIPSNIGLDVSFTFSVVYFILYRWKAEGLVSTNIPFPFEIYYGDIILWVTFWYLFNLCASYFWRYKTWWENISQRNRKNIDTSSNIVVEDEAVLKPYFEKINFRLDREKFARNLVLDLKKAQSKKAVAVGITGDWGSGKTRFLHYMKQAIKQDENTISISFNPWYSETPNNIIRDYFYVLEKVLGRKNANISTFAIRYIEALLPAKSRNIFSSSFANFINTFILKKSFIAEDEYINLNREIRKIQKKIFVFIDDLDRLSKDEVVEVLRLIRNTADFANFKYIVAYDRNYTVEAINSLSNYKPSTYLEKIFQLEITLPEIEKPKLYELFKAIIKDKTEESIYNSLPNESMLFTRYVSNIRDVIRLCNLFVYDIQNVEGNIDIVEFLNLRLIKLFYPNLFEVFFRNTGKYLILKKKSDNDLIYMLRKEKDEEFTSTRSMFRKAGEENRFLFEKYLSTLHVSDIEKNLILETLNTIFCEKSRNLFNSVTTGNFHLYSNPILFQKDLDINEFKNVISKNFEEETNELTKKLEKLIHLGKGYSLNLILSDLRKDFNYLSGFAIDKVSFNNIVEISFILNENEVVPNTSIINFLIGYHKEISQSYFDDNIEDFNSYLLNLLKKYPNSSYVYELIFEQEDHFLKDDQLVQLQIEVLQSILENLQVKNSQSNWLAFHNMLYVCNYEFSNSALRVFKEDIKESVKPAKLLIEKQPILFLQTIFSPRPGQANFYRFDYDNYIGTVYEDLDSFYESLNNALQSNKAALKEFQFLMEKRKSSSFDDSIVIKSNESLNIIRPFF